MTGLVEISCFTLVKAACCSSDHWNGLSFLRRSAIGRTTEAYAGTKRMNHPVVPRKLRSSRTLEGGGASTTARTVDWSGTTPAAESLWPQNSMLVCLKTDLSLFMVTLARARRFSTSWRRASCSW